MSDFVGLERRDRIAVVSLERPEAHNALSGAMCDELHNAFDVVAADNEVWVMVLRAEGDKAFCVGADLKERSSFTLEDFRANRVQVRGMFETLRKVPQPTVVAPFGFALGGGMELVLSCDVVVAARGTIFGLPEVRVGLVPGGGGTQLLARKIGLGRAKDLIFRGARFDGDEAHALGLAAEVVPRDELDEAALSIAEDICKSSPVAVRAAKRAIDASFDVDLATGINNEHAAWKVTIESDDRREGIAAFNEKRNPEWKNR